MNKEEAKMFIIQKMNECVLMKHKNYPESIIYIWDKQLLREKKLRRVLKKNELIDFKPNKYSIELFEADFKNKYFWCESNKIWSFLEANYNDNYNEIQSLVKSVLEEQDKLGSLTPWHRQLRQISQLEKQDKLGSLTPHIADNTTPEWLEEQDKLRNLTPIAFPLENNINWKNMTILGL